MASNRSLSVICYDFPKVIRFFRSVALAVATQKYTQVEWVEYNDSTALNIAYAIMPWKAMPGYAEVNTGTRHQVQVLTDDLQVQYLQVWLKKLHEGGPRASNEYVKQMTHVRDVARDFIAQMFREASNVNDMVMNQTSEAIQDLAKVKLGAQVGVAVLGAVVGVAFVAAAAAGGAAAGGGVSIIVGNAGAGGLAFGGVGFGHSVAHSLIKSWDQGPVANVGGVLWETGKAGTSEGLGHAAGTKLDAALKGTAQTEAKLAKLQKDITRHSAALGKRSVRGAARTSAGEALLRKQGMQATEKAAAQGFAKNAGRAALGGTLVPVVFAAWDINDAISDYRDTVGAL